MPEHKISYTIACSSAFRDAVTALADKRGVNVADLARSMLLSIPSSLIALYPDPGGPAGDDRETITLKSGAQAGRVSRRKPRLQVRLPAGYNEVTIRKCLNLALSFDNETMSLHVRDPHGPFLGDTVEVAKPAPPPAPDLSPQLAEAQAKLTAAERETSALRDQLDRLRAVLDVVAFEPLADGVQTYGEALFVFGYPPSTHPDTREIRARYRILATVHHPDSPFGSHARMSQINAAMDLLRQGA